MKHLPIEIKEIISCYMKLFYFQVVQMVDY